MFVYHALVHVIMDIFIPTLCSTAADIARDVAGLRTVERAAANSYKHTHTYTHSRTKTSTTAVAVGRRRNVQSLILCCFFFPFRFAFYIVIACALCTPIFVFYNTRRRHVTIYQRRAHSLPLTLAHTVVQTDYTHTHTPARTDRYTRTHGHNTTHDVIYNIIFIIAYVCGVREYLEFTRIESREKDPEWKRVFVREEGRSSAGLRCRIVSVSRRVYGKGQDPATSRLRREMD